MPLTRRVRPAGPLLGLALLALPLGGCLSDADTANNRSVLPPASQPTRAAKDGEEPDNPRQLCEATVEGGESKTICY